MYDLLGPVALKTPEWPKGIAARALKNRFLEEWHGREDELRRKLDEIAPTYLKALEQADPDICPLYMGQSADFVDAVRPAAEVLRDICEDAERILKERLSHLA